MAHPSLRVWLIWMLKANAIVWAINTLLFAILAFAGGNLTGLASLGYFSKVTLLETGISFLIAGAIAFSGSVLPNKAKEYAGKTEEKWSMDKLRKSEKKANKYIALAVVLFAESLLISLVGF